MSNFLATGKQKRYIMNLLFRLKDDDEDNMLLFFLPEITKQFEVVGCENLENWQNLTKAQASSIIDFLIKLPDTKNDTLNLIFSLISPRMCSEEKWDLIMSCAGEV
jgi:hypothetical protein